MVKEYTPGDLEKGIKEARLKRALENATPSVARTMLSQKYRKLKSKRRPRITVPAYLRSKEGSKCPKQPKNQPPKAERRKKDKEATEKRLKAKAKSKQMLEKVKKFISARREAKKSGKKVKQPKPTEAQKSAKRVRKLKKRAAILKGDYKTKREIKMQRRAKQIKKKTKRTTINSLKHEMLAQKKKTLKRKPRKGRKHLELVKMTNKQLRFISTRAKAKRNAHLYTDTSKTVKKSLRKRENTGNKRPKRCNTMHSIRMTIQKLKKMKPAKAENKKKVAHKIWALAKKLRFKLKKRKARRMRLQAPKKFVEIGRVCTVLKGCCRGSLCVITDILDHNWVVADGKCFPKMDCGRPLKRRKINIKNLRLTHLKVKLNHGLCTRWLTKLMTKERIWKKFTRSMLYFKIQKYRAKRWATDLERWRVQYNRHQRSFLIASKFFKLKKKVLAIARRRFGHKRLSKKRHELEIAARGKKVEKKPKKERAPHKPKEALTKDEVKKARKHRSKLTPTEKRFLKQNISFRDVHAKGWHLRRRVNHC